MLTDREIIQGFLKGDKHTYGTVIGWIEDVIKTRLWENSIEPQDIISDTSYKLLQNFRSNSFEYKSALKTYVHRITYYTIIDAVRRRRREAMVFHSIQTDIHDSTAQEKSIIFNESQEIFQRVISLIDIRCLELWIMIFHERLKYKQIANRLGVNVNTIKTRVFRCKEAAILIKKSIE